MVFALARFLPVSDVGLYGLFTATVAYALYPLGFDFYTYATRQFVREDKSRRRVFIASQLTFSAMIFVALTPVLAVMFALGLMPWSLAAWLFLLLPLEYIGLEIDRLLIAMSDQIAASVILFIGGALNPLFVIPILWAVPHSRQLSTVFATWLIFDVFAAIAGLAFLISRTRGADRPSIDWSWIKRGARASTPFLIGTLCLRILFTADRQLVKIFGDLESLGAYTFYMTIGASLTSVLYASIHQFAYPRLVASAHAQKYVIFKQQLRSLLLQTIAAILCVAAIGIAAEPLLLRFVNNDIYRTYAWMLPIVFAIIGIYNISMVPHYALYAIDADRAILLITVLAVLVFAAASATIAPRHPVAGVLIGLAGASTTLLLGKFAIYRIAITHAFPRTDHA